METVASIELEMRRKLDEVQRWTVLLPGFKVKVDHTGNVLCDSGYREMATHMNESLQHNIEGTAFKIELLKLSEMTY